jgi:hypothetical protein
MTTGDIPILINVRDRVRELRKLVAWLEDAGQTNLVLLDNASSYPPLLAYLEDSPHTVLSLGENLGARGFLQSAEPEGRFIYTDPDLVPIEDCPTDLVAHLCELADRYPQYRKIGAGLYLDDVPAGLPCLDWERSLVAPEREMEPGVFASQVDTTFALYKENARFGHEAIRTGYPYQMRHMPWYTTELDDEDAYYLAHAIQGDGGTTSWLHLPGKEPHATTAEFAG